MQVPPEPEVYAEKLKKQNRIQKLMLRPHKIFHESGRSIKVLWQKIIQRSKGEGI